MTIQTPYHPLNHACDGSKRGYSVTWPFFNAVDLRVTYITQAGAALPLTLKTGYTVRGGRSGHGLAAVGTIETTAIYAPGEIIRIERVTPRTQDLAFADGVFPAKHVEAALDRAMMILEEIGAALGPVLEVMPRKSSIAVPPLSDAQLRSMEATAKGVRDEARATAGKLASDLHRVEQQLAQMASRPASPVFQKSVSSVDPLPSDPVRDTEPDRPATLAAAVHQAWAELNADAGKVRAMLATPGKDLVYVQKQTEARACLDDDDPMSAQRHPETGEPINKYPHLAAMIGAWVPRTADAAADMRSAAIMVLGRAADFKMRSALIEATHDAAKQRLISVQTIDEALLVPAGVTWPFTTSN